MVTVVSPPNFNTVPNQNTIFLGGSIEMGKAPKWQEEFIKLVQEKSPAWRDYTIYNPRREDWDPSWKQTITDPQFFQQVQWELDYLSRVQHRVFYFAADTLSPITLLELGTHAQNPNTYVIAHPSYLRRGNLEVYCHHYDIPLYETFDDQRIISRIL